ncbi:type II secretion system major pseudopilin GspG [Teredinibacter waterburyi]|uniref:type II secretion system major pseudopilin GspG n=1 Tax=Teredinibacter waterburyi TaxID=1500538 RepID=UPI00165F2C86|nr:type II secretion system major pseudopilin GspG [Teredinibacter waterburyi]
MIKAKNMKGFSLIEIMVVLVIMGLLASIVAPNVMEALSGSKLQKVQADFANIETALKMYKLDNFVYPSSEQGLEALVSRPSSSPEPKNWRKGGYLPELPEDPWGTPYLYTSPADGHPYEIYTLGADGVRGGQEEGTDIGNWDKAGDNNQ